MLENGNLIVMTSKNSAVLTDKWNFKKKEEYSTLQLSFGFCLRTLSAVAFDVFSSFHRKPDVNFGTYTLLK